MADIHHLWGSCDIFTDRKRVANHKTPIQTGLGALVNEGIQSMRSAKIHPNVGALERLLKLEIYPAF